MLRSPGIGNGEPGIVKAAVRRFTILHSRFPDSTQPRRDLSFCTL
ncbi:hypothetical protein [Lysobacter gummosus]